MRKLLWWLSGFLQVRVIDIDGSPYLERYLVGRWRGMVAYLHHFVRGDAEPWLHDHRWKWSIAIVLRGSYVEERWSYLCPAAGLVTSRRRVRMFNLIRPKDFHRIVSVEPNTWTLFIHAPRSNKGWGFLHQLDFANGSGFKLSYVQPFKGEREKDFPDDAPTGREYRAGDRRFFYYEDGSRLLIHQGNGAELMEGTAARHSYIVGGKQ